MKKISFIIVNYRSREYLGSCIDSIFKCVKGVEYEVIVVNNDRSRIRSGMTNDEKLKIVEVNENIGFGRAHNIGAKEASGEILCFLNPDTEILSDNINELLDEFKKNKNIGVIGPRISERNSETQEWSVGVDINLVEVIRSNLGFSRSEHVWKSEEKREVDWITGAAMFIKKDLFLRLEGFDEKFFLYFEDIDLCKRVRESKNKVIYFPKFKIKHLGGKSNINKVKQKKEYYKSQDYYFEKWFGKKMKLLVSFLRKFHF